MIVVRDGEHRIVGTPGGRLFRQGLPTADLADGARLEL